MWRRKSRKRQKFLKPSWTIYGELGIATSNFFILTEYPKIVQLDIEDEEIPAYVERFLKDGHKWKEEKDVLASIEEIDEEDKIVRTTDKFVRYLFLFLGQALDPQTEVAKAHAASIEEAANAW